ATTAPPAWWRRWRPPAWSPHPSTTATARSWRRHRPSHGAGEKAGIGCRNGAGRDPSATPGALVSRPDPDAPAVRPRPDALRWHRGGQRGARPPAASAAARVLRLLHWMGALRVQLGLCRLAPSMHPTTPE